MLEENGKMLKNKQHLLRKNRVFRWIIGGRNLNTYNWQPRSPVFFVFVDIGKVILEVNDTENWKICYWVVHPSPLSLPTTVYFRPNVTNFNIREIYDAYHFEINRLENKVQKRLHEFYIPYNFIFGSQIW